MASQVGGGSAKVWTALHNPASISCEGKDCDEELEWSWTGDPFMQGRTAPDGWTEVSNKNI